MFFPVEEGDTQATSPCPWQKLPPPLSLRVALALLFLCNPSGLSLFIACSCAALLEHCCSSSALLHFLGIAALHLYLPCCTSSALLRLIICVAALRLHLHCCSTSGLLALHQPSCPSSALLYSPCTAALRHLHIARSLLARSCC